MPYINDTDKYAVDCGGPTKPGQLNYAITEVLLAYLEYKGKSYSTLNDIVGALECAKAEFIRRVVNDYENQKMIENGDVYS